MCYFKFKITHFIDGLETLANTIPTAATGSKSNSLQHAFIRSLILSTPPEGYISLCSVIANAQGPEYEKIMVPLLIIAGEEDKTAPKEQSKRILENYGTEGRRKRIEVLMGVGHWHCLERGDEVARLVGDFIGSLD